MITAQTVLILGAGASASYGYPTSAQLTENILGNLKIENQHAFEKLIACGFKVKEISDFRNSFYYSGVLSIDSFLEKRIEYKNVGKAAIAQQLMQVEINSDQLFYRNHWYAYLLNKMHCREFEDFKNNKISFITFNYDRSLEHFLSTALMEKYGKTIEEISEVLQQIKIIHVYGQLGFLEWQTTDETKRRAYGDFEKPDAIKISADGIKIVSDNESDTAPGLIAAQECIKKADRIFFLGFGYDPENMRRLKLPLDKALTGEKFFSGTGYGLTQTESWALTNKYYEGLQVGEPNLDILQYLRNQDRFIYD